MEIDDGIDIDALLVTKLVLLLEDVVGLLDFEAVKVVDLLNRAEHALERRTEAELADVEVRHQVVDIGLPNTEEVWLLAVLLRIPPTVTGVHHARVDGDNEMGLLTGAAEWVLDLDPVAFLDAGWISISG